MKTGNNPSTIKGIDSPCRVKYLSLPSEGRATGRLEAKCWINLHHRHLTHCISLFDPLFTKFLRRPVHVFPYNRGLSTHKHARCDGGCGPALGPTRIR